GVGPGVEGDAERADRGDEAAVGPARGRAVDAALGDQAAGRQGDAVQGGGDGGGVGPVEVAVVGLGDDLAARRGEGGVVAGQGAVVGVDAEVLVVDVDDADAIDRRVEVVATGHVGGPRHGVGDRADEGGRAGQRVDGVGPHQGVGGDPGRHRGQVELA